mmetsp:Transcript_74440/g.206736  ORF Transcript_74440/g.206736 Transcript_74440/m.206736 type:complete len:358 (+) Transcript_74440:37-1110(+)
MSYFKDAPFHAHPKGRKTSARESHSAQFCSHTFAMATELPELVSVAVLFLSGKDAWGPEPIDAACTARELCCRILREAPARPRHAYPSLMRGAVPLMRRDVVCSPEEKKRGEAVLSMVWSPVQWPVPVDFLRLVLEPVLEPFLEKAPRWQQLRSAPSANVRGFARGFLKRIQENGASRVSLVIEMLGLPAISFQALPDAHKQRLQRLASGSASIDDRDEASLAEMIQSICVLASDPTTAQSFGLFRKATPRMLREWPTRRELRKAASLLVGAQLWEDFEGGDLTVRTEDVNLAVAALFLGRPDFSQIRRSMLELGILKQKSISPSYFQLNAASSQLCLAEVLALDNGKPSSTDLPST